jgi:hypothetical protein
MMNFGWAAEDACTAIHLRPTDRMSQKATEACPHGRGLTHLAQILLRANGSSHENGPNGRRPTPF